MRLRGIIFTILSVILCGIYISYGQTAHDFFRNGENRAYLGAAAGLIGTGMVFCFPRLSTRGTVLLILLLSLCVRLAVLPSGASDDVNRYLWEGKLYAEGVSPFTEVADHEIYKDHRDSYWEEMNHRDKITAYPPLSLHIFSFINAFSYSPMSYKVIFVIADLFLIAFILAILRHYQRPLHWALIYALSPISILSFAAEGHFDIIMMLFLVFSILAYSRKWFILCGAAVGLAVASKIMVVIVAPVILLKTGAKGIIAAAVTCSLPFLLHFDDTLRMIEGLVSFGSKNNFNGPFNQFFDLALGIDTGISNKICGILFILSWGIGFWFSIKDKLWISLTFCIGGLILFSPIVHFWYLTWLLPFIAIRPSFSWMTLSVTTPLYFLVHAEYLATGNWGLPLWAKWVFWLPFFLVTIAFLPKRIVSIYRQLFLKSSLIHTGKATWSVVIPTLSIDANIKKVINDLEKQSTSPDEVIIVSTEENNEATLQSSTFKIKTTHSERSRGLQIKTGVECATQEWCLILHGDNQLAPASFEKLNNALAKNGNIIGGSLGQRFNRSSLGLLLIESMNDFRATLLQTSFGDQNQFFHTKTVIENNVLADQPLMEDVEMSDRLGLHGELLHLAYESTVSAEKWQRPTYWKRFFTIVGFYFKYRLLFFSSRKREELSKQFYLKYYPQAKV